MAQRLGLLALTGWLLLAPDATGHALAQRIMGPLRIVILVDSSSAVAPMINQFRAGLNAFLDDLPEGPEIALISTGGQLRVRVPPTTDRERLRKEIARFASDGGANALVDSLIEADNRFLKPTTEHKPTFVLLMTDLRTAGYELRADQYNRYVEDFMRRRGRAHGVVIHGVNMGLTTDIVMNLTGNTAGYYEVMAVPNALPLRMKQMAEMVAADIQ